MKFNEYKYERPNIEFLISEFERLTNIIKDNNDINIVKSSIDEVNKLSADF